jgi:diguanylate cyclase (GGDEF)-like protein
MPATERLIIPVLEALSRRTMREELPMRLSGIPRQWAPCLFAATVGIGVSVTVAGMIANRESRYAEEKFKVVAENHAMVLQNGLNERVNRLRAVRALFDSSEAPVTRAGFEAFVRPLLVEDTAITTLSWVPRVSRNERADYELAAVSQGIPNYQIKMMAEDGTMLPSPERSEYYPIFYGTVPKTSPLYGLDLRSEPAKLAEMEQARDVDRLGFSRVGALVSSGGLLSGSLFSLPVYRQGLPHNTVEDRRQNLQGFVHGSITFSTMIGTTMAEGIDLFFFAPNAGPEDPPVFMHGSRLRQTPAQPLSASALAAGPHWSRDLMADGQRWLTMEVVPMPDGPLIVRHDRAWIVLIFGFIFTAVAMIYMSVSRRHTMHMMQVNKKVSDLARIDVLTSLANRRAFMARLSAAFAARDRGAKPFAVLYFDVDHFKDINDTLGHSVGDALLRQIAARVVGNVRTNDVVARIGGDEFAILQSDADAPDAAGALAAKIAKVLAEPYAIDGNQVHISVSIGISRYGPDAEAPDEIMIQADLALYRAKADGRNCIRFHSADLDREVKERVLIADELRGAIARNELELHYQPQVELRSGRIIGLEALLRWNHPKYGRIPPSIFIPIAERSGQIQLLGQWVLDAACRQFRSWQDQGIAPQLVGVNVSALHFKGSVDLDRDVAASLDKWGVAAGQIEIELTESVLMDITQQYSERFERLRQLGVRIAIDDFGTGYSSLSYLAKYPVNRVKIAQELVFGVDADSRSATVVRAAIRLAHELGIDVIAEGVETEGQAKFLLSAGCKHCQGYYFSRPVNVERVTELLRSGSFKPPHRSLRLVETSVA